MDGESCQSVQGWKWWWHIGTESEKQWPCWTKLKLTGIEGPIKQPKKVADEEGDSKSHHDDNEDDKDEMIDGDD